MENKIVVEQGGKEFWYIYINGILINDGFLFKHKAIELAEEIKKLNDNIDVSVEIEIRE